MSLQFSSTEDYLSLKSVNRQTVNNKQTDFRTNATTWQAQNVGNRWNKQDLSSYKEHELVIIPTIPKMCEFSPRNDSVAAETRQQFAETFSILGIITSLWWCQCAVFKDDSKKLCKVFTTMSLCYVLVRL